MFNSRKDSKTYKNNVEALESLKKTFESLESRHGKPLSPVTIKNYVAKVNKLSCLVLDHAFDGDLKWLNSPDKVIAVLQKSNATGLKDFISPIVRLLKTKNELDPKILDAYQKAMTSFKTEEYSVRKKNVSTQKEIEKSISLPDIIQKINDYKPKIKTELTYLLICKLYFQGSVVFRNDLSSMKLVSNSKKLKDMNENFNYITLDKAGAPVSVIMKNYKSSPTYGTQKFPVLDEVQKCLIEYLKMTGKHSGDYLFSKGEIPYNKDTIRALIEKATEAVLGKALNINLIRKIQITHFLRRGPHSIEDSEIDAKRYLHSVNQHSEYLGLGLKHTASGSDSE
jgi:hypothetical protein